MLDGSRASAPALLLDGRTRIDVEEVQPLGVDNELDRLTLTNVCTGV
jgi:hypothetical protein